METPVTLSPKPSPKAALDFELLRREAIAYIQRLSGNIWTDYNTHDPGVTILEVLCYAITDLAYRANQPIQDLLADEQGSLNEQFFNASQILPSKPLTLEDYRKLLMDVEIVNEGDSLAPFAGIKNAWVEIRPTNEIPIYPDRKAKKLAYKPFPAKEEALKLGILYDVLLEFDHTEGLGDLNENKLSMEIEVDQHPDLKGMVIDIQVQFPRWDENIDWENPSSAKKAIQDICIQFQQVPSGFDLTYSITANNSIELSGTELTATGLEPIVEIDTLSSQVNDFVFDAASGMLGFYLEKIKKIKEILDAARNTLNANRNLCEDFVSFHALRVEEILVCADLELSPEADVELTEARILAAIGDFLSPQVNFYRLEEMLHRCKSGALTISRIQQNPAKIWLELDPDRYPKIGSLISILGSGNNVGTYEILEIRPASKEAKLAEISLSPNFTSPLLRDDDRVFLGEWESEQCLPTEKIFEGPLLRHGFIDSNELALADRKSQLHVSDLIHLIMNIDGVLAVKSIQIANLPQDDPDGKIPSKSVRWCLKLAIEQNYVPRLNPSLSKIMYYKEGLPFKANTELVEELLKEIQSKNRNQKIRYPDLDFPEKLGEFADAGAYFSIQNDFPLIYGVGEEGMMPEAEGRPQAHEVKQLKAYLMVFEQLLANYLAQLAHVKELFSFSDQKDRFGNLKISNTYFSQQLPDLVPDSAALWKDLSGLKQKVADLTESKSDFLDRRNRFLNHLIGRFAEQLVDYSLISLRIQGESGKEQLIEDKLSFLSQYPKLSSERGLGMNHTDSRSFYHPSNRSGLENRLGALYGIRKKEVSWLRFRPNFVLNEDSGIWKISVNGDASEELFEIKEEFSSWENAALALENLILLGAQQGFWEIQGSAGNLKIALVDHGQILGESLKTDYADLPEAQLDLEKLQGIFLREFLQNPRSNRKNLSLGIQDWFQYSISVNYGSGTPSYQIDFEFQDAPFGLGKPVLKGKIEQEESSANSEAELEQLAEASIPDHFWKLLAAASRDSGYQLDPDQESPYKFSVIDPVRGGLLAKSVDADFNQLLASQLLDGTWGQPKLLQDGYSPVELSLTSSTAIGSKILVKADVIPSTGDLLVFEKSLEIELSDPDNHLIQINGNHLEQLKGSKEITISLPVEGEDLTFRYEIFELKEESGKTLITTRNELRADLESGSLVISKEFKILTLIGDQFVIAGGQERKAILELQNLVKNEFFNHEGSHLIEHILLRPKFKGKYKFRNEADDLVTETIEDRLLDPHFQEECQCTLDDPYTCMGHVVLPYWAGRFTNREFRKFLENKIRLEAPAHVFLTICWISPLHLEELEYAWKIWQLETLKPNFHPKNQSNALSRLIEVLEKVRNVYPAGTLHDCAEDDSLADAIILNFSSLGQF